jgi:transcriptional regulator with XRE-family HTH domain
LFLAIIHEVLGLESKQPLNLNDKLLTKIGAKIRKIRELKGFSQEYMGSSLGITQNSYRKLENQKTKLSLERIHNIAEILEIDPLDLITSDENLVFNKYSQCGKMNTINNHFSKKLKEQYEKQIIHLKEEIVFLRSQLPK